MRRYIPKPDPLVDVPPEPTEAELDAIAARRLHLAQEPRP